MWVPWIILYRNCWTIGPIVLHHMFCQIVAFVSISFVVLFMAVQVSLKFFLEILHGSIFFLSRMPLYAVTWVREKSFAPWTLNSSGVTFLGLQFSFFTCLLILSHHLTSPFIPSITWPHHLTAYLFIYHVILFGRARDSHWLLPSSTYPRVHAWVGSTRNDSIFCMMTPY